MGTIKKLDADRVYRDKLQSSGLTVKDANELKIEFLNKTQTKKLQSCFKDSPSLKFNYHAPDGQPLEDIPEGGHYYRLRYLKEETNKKAFQTDESNKKSPRYVQAPNTAPVAYYPQNFKEWDKVATNPDMPLIITEGELKAAKACKHGFPTIGLGGVNSWCANKLGIEWLPSLQLVEWVRRNVYICFDSDYRTNQNVCKALFKLAEQLERLGAFVHLVSLPDIDGLNKVGLDDFLVFYDSNGPRLFEQLLHEAEPLGLTKVLFGFNERYCYVRSPGFVSDLKDIDQKISAKNFKDHLESKSQYMKADIDKNGDLRYSRTPASGAWLTWPLRHEVDKLLYEPGEEKFFIKDGSAVLNTWKGWGCEPQKGSVKPFLKLLDHLFIGAEPEALNWFLQWCAYPIQNPGVKMFSSAVIHGVTQGTGKSLIGYTLGEIYGENFSELTETDMHKGDNDWCENASFVMGDEVTGSDKRRDADYLKNLITRKKIRINIKYVPRFTIRDCINYFFTSQHADSFFLEDRDRRFFIHEVISEPLPPKFFQDYDEWLYRGKGASYIFHYLLNYDTSTFNPFGHAMRTSAKDRMTTMGQSELAAWVRTLINSPDQVLRVGTIVVDKDLFTAKELLAFYDPESVTRTTSKGLAKELSRAGLHQVNKGATITTSDGSTNRYWAIRNINKWLKTPLPNIVKYLEEQQTKQLLDKDYKY